MRFARCPQKLRARVTRGLLEAFRTEDTSNVRALLGEVAEHFEVKIPIVEFVDRVDLRGAKAATFNSGLAGVIQLIKPSAWKRRRPTADDVERRMGTSPEDWTHVALHELYHIIVWHRDEEKADEFAHKFVSLA